MGLGLSPTHSQGPGLLSILTFLHLEEGASVDGEMPFSWRERGSDKICRSIYSHVFYVMLQTATGPLRAYQWYYPEVLVGKQGW